MRFYEFLVSRSRRARKKSVCRRLMPRLESLEDRSLPSTFTVINLDDAGQGSGLEGDLRYAINTANANAEPSNSIQFQPGLTGTIVLTQRALAITKDLEITGPGQDLLTVSGNHRSGVFHITDDPRVRNVRMTDLTIADGTGIVSPLLRRGGGLFNDHAALTLTRVTVSGNSIPQLGKGAGIYNNTGALTLESCTVIDNHGGEAADGGGIYNETGPLTIRDSTIAQNSVGGPLHLGAGGGINNFRGVLTLSHSAVIQNTAGAIGGIRDFAGVEFVDHSTISKNVSLGFGAAGIFGNGYLQVSDSTVADNVGGAGLATNFTMKVERSTISGNFNPRGFGGGIWQAGTGHIEIDNSTISDNTALEGGGVRASIFPGTVKISYSTIYGNHAVGTQLQQGGGGIFIDGTLPFLPFGQVVIDHTIVAHNDSAAPFTGQDVDGPVISLRYNFIGIGDFSDGWFPPSSLGDEVGTADAPLDPMLGPLQDNGGPTLTRAPLFGAPFRWIDPGEHTPDQRGTFRFICGCTGAVAHSPAAALRVNAPTTVSPGQPFQVTVTAVDQWGNTASTYVGTLHVSSTDPDAQLPDDYTLTPEEGGSHTFTVTLQTPGPQTLSIQDTSDPSLAVELNVVVDGGSALFPFWWKHHQPDELADI
jgi:hypothetical protein